MHDIDQTPPPIGLATPPAGGRLADTLDEALGDVFGFESFRRGQREALEAIAAGDDCLVVMPTGGGKSLCYQLSAAVRDGVTLVISPLIALMKDQVDGLQAKGIAAIDIHSAMDFDEQQRRIAGLRRGDYKLVYVAPERFRSHAFLQALAGVEVDLLAVDEAHCISQWGHDFRPDYLRIADIRAELGMPQVVALTATATTHVQADILEQLRLDDGRTIVSGFERPNLFFEVFHARSHDAKIDRICALADHYDGQSVIVYCATRKQVRQVAGDLARRKVDVGTYHGGMDELEREASQDAWMSGQVGVLVATNAFGMGVDKPDVRAVVHYNMPGSIEAYYQEAGRAGRDSEPAHCLLCFNYADRGIHEFFAENTYPGRAELARVWDLLCGLGEGTHAVGADQISGQLGRQGPRVHSFAVDSCLRLLRDVGHIDLGSRHGADWVAVFDTVPFAELGIDWDGLETRKRVAAQQLDSVVQYATQHTCHQRELLGYFGGEPSFGDKCGNCDYCSGQPAYVAEHADMLLREIATEHDAETITRMVLAGVARARAKRGASLVAAMLRGSSAKKVREAGFDRLSTFGLLSELNQDDLVYLIDALTRHQLITRNEHGCVGLTELGGEVMRSDQEVPRALVDLLDASLVETRRRRSTSSSTRSRSGDAAAGSSDTYDATLALILDGKSPVEIAAERGIKERTVLDHYVVLADRGEKFDLSAQIDPTLLERLATVAADWTYGDKLRPLKDAVGDDVSYADLKIHLAQLLMDRCHG